MPKENQNLIAECDSIKELLSKENQNLDAIQKEIIAECDSIKELLLAKNREYGASAFQPINVFSSLTAEEQINVRIDDKLRRIQTIKSMDSTKIHEDSELDLLGYLILKRVIRKINSVK
jgi:hypothetical protein